MHCSVNDDHRYMYAISSYLLIFLYLLLPRNLTAADSGA